MNGSRSLKSSFHDLGGTAYSALCLLERRERFDWFSLAMDTLNLSCGVFSL